MNYIGKHISALPTPAFIVDKEKVEKNCKRMLDLAKYLIHRDRKDYTKIYFLGAMGYI